MATMVFPYLADRVFKVLYLQYTEISKKTLALVRQILVGPFQDDIEAD